MTDIQKRILVVDDDPALLEHLVVTLSSYRSLTFTTATNGLEAIDIIESDDIDLVVTDVQMPEMDGFGLASYINQKHPKLPVIIISAQATPALEDKLNRLGIVSFEKKPIDTDRLAERIFDLLVGVDSGYLQGISIPSFLQVLHADRISCTLKVTDGTETGYLHLIDGQVRDAEFRGLKGTKAAMEIIGWDASITIDIQHVVRLKESTIAQDLTYLIMETLRRKDEFEAGSGTSQGDDGANELVLPVRNSVPPGQAAAAGRQVCINVGRGLPEKLSDDTRALCDCALQRLFDVKGYRASAVLAHDGRPIVSHARQANIDAEFIAQNIHDMFASLQERGRYLGMGPIDEAVFRSRDGLVLVRCISAPDKPHIHVMAVFKGAEGEGLMRIRLKRVAEEAADYAAEEL